MRTYIRRIRLCPDCQRPISPWAMTRRCKPCAYVARKNSTRPARPCLECGKPFYPALVNLSRGWGKWCSRPCHNAWHKAREKVGTVACAQCGTVFRRRLEHLKRVKRAFCSPECSHRFHRGKNTANWRGGSDPNRGQNWRRRAELIRDRDDRCCVRCGRSEEENGEKLSVDHRIPWRYIPKRHANHPDNLVSLCRFCHSWKTAAENRWMAGDMQAISDYLKDVKGPCVHSLPGRWKTLRVDLEALALKRLVVLMRRSA